MNFIWMLFAHFIGDWAFQSDWMAKNKAKLWFVMFSHCMIWTGCICIALEYMGIYALWKMLFLLAGHWIFDEWKASKPQTAETWHYLYYDQGWHGIQLAVVFLI